MGEVSAINKCYGIVPSYFGPRKSAMGLLVRLDFLQRIGMAIGRKTLMIGKGGL